MKFNSRGQNISFPMLLSQPRFSIYRSKYLLAFSIAFWNFWDFEIICKNYQLQSRPFSWRNQPVARIYFTAMKQFNHKSHKIPQPDKEIGSLKEGWLFLLFPVTIDICKAAFSTKCKGTWSWYSSFPIPYDEWQMLKVCLHFQPSAEDRTRFTSVNSRNVEFTARSSACKESWEEYTAISYTVVEQRLNQAVFSKVYWSWYCKQKLRVSSLTTGCFPFDCLIISFWIYVQSNFIDYWDLSK